MAEWQERQVIPIEESGIDDVQVAKCPFCGRYLTTPYMYYFTEYNFCPWCGAKMKKEEENADRD